MRHLFIVNGLGLGNSSRCLALLRELEAKGDSVDVMTAHNGLRFFRAQKIMGDIHAQEQVRYGESFGARALLSVFFDNLRILWRNSRRQRELIEKNHYDVIWVDSDLGHLLWRRTGARIHAVNHSYLVVRDYFKVPRRLRRGSAFHFLLKLMDFTVIYLRADLIVCPEVTERDPEVSLGKIQLCGPLAKFSREVKREPGKVVISFSGHSHPSNQKRIERTLSALTGQAVTLLVNAGEGPSHIADTVRLAEKNPEQRDTELASAELIITNAGHSTLSEAVSSGVPLVISPFAGHAEQIVNAHRVLSLGLGTDLESFLGRQQ